MVASISMNEDNYSPFVWWFNVVFDFNIQNVAQVNNQSTAIAVGANTKWCDKTEIPKSISSASSNAKSHIRKVSVKQLDAYYVQFILINAFRVENMFLGNENVQLVSLFFFFFVFQAIIRNLIFRRVQIILIRSSQWHYTNKLLNKYIKTFVIITDAVAVAMDKQFWTK